ncbi:MAG: hypothetical protein IPI40_14255 [Betaproteobacteria bacterium]|nr:hypothetical protein [Betaproteobacteria bacterium]
MSEHLPGQRSDPDAAGALPAPADAIRAELDRVLASDEFATSARLRDMLRFLVDESLAGRVARLKGYRIAVEVFHRDPGFDADTDPLVRIQAGRLRRALDRYYATAGARDPLRIGVPKGGYVPAFTVATGGEVAAVATDPGRGPAEGTRPPVVAVLPFQSLSSDPEQAYFAEGLAAELTLALTRFDGMAVIARQSSLQYRNQVPDLPRIGRELGARYLVLGSVQRLGQAMRIDAGLTDAASREVLWNERYAFDLGERDLFAVQDDIAQKVSARVAGRYGAVFRDLGRGAQGQRSAVPGAYDAVLHFYHFVAERSPPGRGRAHAPRWSRRSRSTPVSRSPGRCSPRRWSTPTRPTRTRRPNRSTGRWRWRRGRSRSNRPASRRAGRWPGRSSSAATCPGSGPSSSGRSRSTRTRRTSSAWPDGRPRWRATGSAGSRCSIAASSSTRTIRAGSTSRTTSTASAGATTRRHSRRRR